MTAEFTWQTSSASSTGDNCVEISRIPGGVALREGDSPETVLVASVRRLAALISGVKAGRFERLAP